MRSYPGSASVEPRVGADRVLDVEHLPSDGGGGLVEGPLGVRGGDPGGDALEAQAGPCEHPLVLRVPRDHRGVDDHLERDLGAGAVPQRLHPALVPTLVTLLDVEDDQGTIVPEVDPVLEPNVDALVILCPLDVGYPEIFPILNRNLVLNTMFILTYSSRRCPLCRAA